MNNTPPLQNGIVAAHLTNLENNFYGVQHLQNYREGVYETKEEFSSPRKAQNVMNRKFISKHFPKTHDD